MFDVICYTDGACRGNPGEGGWAYHHTFTDDGTWRAGRGYGGATTTNNRMELTAVVEALRVLPGTVSVQIHSDSKYVVDGVSSWMANWKRRGWKTAAGKPVLNQDLWELIDAEMQKRTIKLVWVKAHNGNKWNEFVDTHANIAIDTRGN